MAISTLDTNPSLLARVAHWIRPEIRALSAYHVPPSADFIKLDAMENPYRWPEDMVEEWLAVLRDVSLNRYPDPAPAGLKASLGEAMGVPAGQDVLLGNGSDELIQMIALSLAQPGRVVLAPEPSFVMYKMIATFTGMDYVGVPLAEDFSLDVEAMLAAIRQHQPAVVFLAYPNNPTGNLFDRAAVRAVIEASPGLVVVDEAYHAFAGDSFMTELGVYDNLVVMRTVSKMGLAGLRLGLLAGPKAWLGEFDKTRLPYNINVLTQVSAEFALAHREVLDGQTRQICTDRERLAAALDALDGVTPFPSRANFILFRVAAAREVFEALKAQGVLIKHMGADQGPLANCLRVTVGSAEENAAFLQALVSAIGK
ncbi:MAG: histidinol-phosphate transaminase [Gammaproteobacteria bacterium]|nr:histidinol-phosphate transaminase [Gammaproteobacteria bacterium]